MDEGYFLHVEDVDFCFRFQAAGGHTYFVPHVKIRHDVGTTTNSRMIELHKIKGFLRYFWKNFQPHHSILTLTFTSMCVLALFAVRSVMLAPSGVAHLMSGRAAHHDPLRPRAA